MRSLALIALLGSPALARADTDPLSEIGGKPPAGAIARRCSVFAELSSVVVGANSVSMKVVLKNTNNTPAKISLGSHCGARYTLAGEPAVTCPPSPCRSAPPKTVTIGARKSLTLATVKVLSKGDSCRAPMPSGSTLFRAHVPTDPFNSDVCSGAVVHVIKDGKTRRLRKAKPDQAPVDPDPPTTKPLPGPPPNPRPPMKVPKQPCPACGIGCPNGTPSRDVDENGCSVCACEDLRPRPPTP